MVGSDDENERLHRMLSVLLMIQPAPPPVLVPMMAWLEFPQNLRDPILDQGLKEPLRFEFCRAGTHGA